LPEWLLLLTEWDALLPRFSIVWGFELHLDYRQRKVVPRNTSYISCQDLTVSQYYAVHGATSIAKS
jgi:hypothetical protein